MCFQSLGVRWPKLEAAPCGKVSSRFLHVSGTCKQTKNRWLKLDSLLVVQVVHSTVALSAVWETPPKLPGEEVAATVVAGLVSLDMEELLLLGMEEERCSQGRRVERRGSSASRDRMTCKLFRKGMPPHQ